MCARDERFDLAQNINILRLHKWHRYLPSSRDCIDGCADYQVRRYSSPSRPNRGCHLSVPRSISLTYENMTLPGAFKKVEHRKFHDPLTMTINPILVSPPSPGDKICGYSFLLVHATGVGDIAPHTSLFLFLFQVGRGIELRGSRSASKS